MRALTVYLTRRARMPSTFAECHRLAQKQALTGQSYYAAWSKRCLLTARHCAATSLRSLSGIAVALVMPSRRARSRGAKASLLLAAVAAVDVRRRTAPVAPGLLARRALPGAIDVRRRAAPVAPRLLSRRALPGAFATAAVAARAARAGASDLLDVCPNCDQPVDALPLATIRGKWELQASWTEDGLQRTLRGTVAFRSLGDPNRGRCAFVADDGQIKGSGSWAEKPARIRKGQFTWSARWRLKLSDGTVLTFRGDTSTGAPDDFMEVRRPPSINDGEVLVEEPVQRRVGAFAATQVVSWQGSDSDEARMEGNYGRAR